MLSFGVSISAICWQISQRENGTVGALRRQNAAARRPYHGEQLA